MNNKYHISKSGNPAICSAKIKCRLGGETGFENHFDSIEETYKYIEEQNSKDLFKKVTKKNNIIKLAANPIDEKSYIEVVDGDLSNPETRFALINGLCGELSKSVRQQTGGDIYFVSYNIKDSEELSKVHKGNRLHEYTTHVMIESTTQKGSYIDAYGRKTNSDIKKYYGEEAEVIKGTEEMLEDYRVNSGEDDSMINFAKAVIELDREGKSYDYYDMTSDQVYIELPNAYGVHKVKDGDLSNVGARQALISGLCGDLALEIHKQNGAAPYFICFGVDSEEEFREDFEEDPSSVYAATHVVSESSKPNHFIDSYGQKSMSELLEYWGDDATIIEGNREMLEAFADKEFSPRLSNFAKSAIRLDEESINYGYEDDED